jgi:hypothetical protein
MRILQQIIEACRVPRHALDQRLRATGIPSLAVNPDFIELGRYGVVDLMTHKSGGRPQYEPKQQDEADPGQTRVPQGKPKT